MGANLLDGKGNRIRGFCIRGEIDVTQTHCKLSRSKSINENYSFI